MPSSNPKPRIIRWQSWSEYEGFQEVGIMNGLSEASARSAHKKKLKQEIMMIFVESDSIYGAPKITEQLHDKAI